MSMNFLSKLANNDYLVDLAVGLLKIGMRPYFHPDKIKELTEWYIPVVVKGGRKKLFNTEVVCQGWLNVCLNTDYKPLEAEDFVQRVLFDKPKMIQNDDFIDNLYEDLNQNP